MKFSLILFLYLFINTTSAQKGFSEGKEEWGYIKVREYAHMFWWLFYTTAEVNYENYYEKPLIIWLQGGPGQSSTGYGNFMQLGPLDLNLEPRNHTWVKNYNVLFIDNPVGTGFSYVEHHLHYSKTNEQIAADLLKFMTEFYSRFPKFSDTPTYVVSESYGGKMTVEFANIWYEKQLKRIIKSNLKGIALGSPWISPVHSVMEYAQTLLYMSMVDRYGYERINNASLMIRKTCEEGSWTEASRLLYQLDTIIYNETSSIDLYNIMSILKLSGDNLFDQLVYGSYRDNVNQLAVLMNTVVKQRLNLDVYWGHTSAVVNQMLEEDFMKPVTTQVEILLNATNLFVYVFNGQLDVVVNSVGTLKWIEELQWKYKINWNLAKRRPMVVNGVIEGYVKKFDRLKMYWINRAGHMATSDNPAAVQALIQDLLDNSSS